MCISRGHLSFLLLTAAAVPVALAASFGPETEVQHNPQFITLYSAKFKYAELGVIISKRYFIVYYGQIIISNADDWTTRFGDPVTGVDLGLRVSVITGEMPYAILKYCPPTTGYKALPFATTDLIDYSKNHSASIFYWRPSTNKFYTRSADVLANIHCDGTDTLTCLDESKVAGSCLHIYDSVDGDDDVKIIAWVIINNKAAGAILPFTWYCDSSNGVPTDRFSLLKLQGFRDQLLEAAPFDIK